MQKNAVIFLLFVMQCVMICVLYRVRLGINMLLGLHVKNFAIIDEVELDFRDNLNILSGETGSGKSILIGSLNCALGGRVSKEMIRKDAEFAYVELYFYSEDEGVKRVFEKYELPEDEGQILISRRIMQNGRSVVKVNGEPTTQAAVKELAEFLLDVHGQYMLSESSWR